MPPEIHNFFDSYRDAFNLLSGARVAGWSERTLHEGSEQLLLLLVGRPSWCQSG